MKNKETTTRKHNIVRNYMGSLGLRYNMEVYNVFGHCSDNRLLKVKKLAEQKHSFNQTSTDELLTFVKNRLEELFHESKDAEVIDRSMMNYFKEENLPIAEEENEEEEEVGEELEEVEVELPKKVHTPEIKLTDYFVKYNIVKHTEFYILSFGCYG